MYDNNLTKEERKAIKKGKAYKSWNKSRWMVILAFLIWAFGGMGLVHINDVTSAIYTIGLLGCLVALFYFLVFSCWKCPVCKEKLPARDLPASTASARVPVLVKTCPHCGADLTEQSEVAK